jgi:transcriptional/translational regulatory protein YebC/TACO1
MGAQWKQKWRELAADKKGKVVGKLVREIQVATKLGGPILSSMRGCSWRWRTRGSRV